MTDNEGDIVVRMRRFRFRFSNSNWTTRDLMDEFWSRKTMRRLALLAVINSLAIPAAAAPPEKGNEVIAAKKAVATPSQHGLRSFLSQGWKSSGQDSVTKQPSTQKPAEIAPPQVTKPAAPRKQKQDAAAEKAKSHADVQPRKTAVVRPQPRLLSVPATVEAAEKVTPLAKAPKRTRLADLLKTAPFSGRADKPVAKTQPETKAQLAAKTQAAAKTQDSAKTQVAEKSQARAKSAVIAKARSVAKPQPAEPSTTKLRNLADVTQKAKTTDSESAPKQAHSDVQPKPVAKSESVAVKRNTTPAKPVAAKAESNFSNLLSKVPAFGRDAAKPSQQPQPASKVAKGDLVARGLEMPVLQPNQSQLLRDTLQKNGFGLLATDQITLPEPNALMDRAPGKQAPQPDSAMIHAAQLQEVAQGLLRDSFHSLRRDASYTARKKATAALRSVVAMRDATEGGNQHSRDLNAALTAIRESREFGAGIEAVDHEQLKRLVAVHKTVALKSKPLDNVSSVTALAAYLDYAREKLVSASGQRHEASYALQLLGQIEQRIAKPIDSHATSIALTYQRSAVEVDPRNSVAQWELARTYDSQGLLEYARAALTKSIEVSPSRSAYEQLMATARKMGDIDTVRICKTALNDSTLPSNLPVYQLEPAVFAATHRPHLAEMQRTQHTTAQANSAQSKQSSAVNANR